MGIIPGYFQGPRMSLLVSPEVGRQGKARQGKEARDEEGLEKKRKEGLGGR